jgi:uncharacterized membrane protein YraQ (UPF0718 family)
MNTGSGPLKRAALFPALVLAVYAVLLVAVPDKTWIALKASVNVLRAVSVPLTLVFVVMFLLNLFVRPARVAGLLGRAAGIRAMLLSTAAGIISVGPIFAWYPLMKKLKQEGAGEGPIAVFLYGRAVKPFLLPLMIAYFGWPYAAILTLLTVAASLVLGYTMGIIADE